MKWKGYLRRREPSGYGVFAADATTKLESCAKALALAKAHDGAAFPGGGGSLYADLYLIPAARRCPPAVPRRPPRSRPSPSAGATSRLRRDGR